MTEREAAELLADTVYDIVIDTESTWTGLSGRQRVQMLDQELRKRRFPFRNRTLLQQVIPFAEGCRESFLENSLKSDNEDQKTLLARSATLFDIAIQRINRIIS